MTILHHNGFCRFPVSRHFPYSATPLPYSRLFGAPLYVTVLHHKGFPVSGHSLSSVNPPTVFKVVPCSPVRARVGFASLRIFTVSRHFWYVSRDRRNDQIPWKVTTSRDFVVFHQKHKKSWSRGGLNAKSLDWPRDFKFLIFLYSLSPQLVKILAGRREILC